MRKIVIHCETNTVGTDSWEFVEVTKDLTNQELDDLAYEYALSNAEMHDIYPPCDSDPDDEAERADDSISGYWYDYIPAEHDGYTMRGIPNWK